MGWLLLVCSALTLGWLVVERPLLGFLLVGSALFVGAVDATRAVKYAILTICAIGLARRLLSGGRVDQDPLLLLPVFLLLLSLLAANAYRVEKRGWRKNSWDVVPVGLALGLGLTAAISWVMVDQSLGGVYVTALLMTCCAALAGAARGLIPDARGWLYSKSSWFLLALSDHGIIQYVFLPPWDAGWMRAVNLSSVGEPTAFRVRVFGSLESPGPYAMVVAIFLVLSLHRLVFDGFGVMRLLPVSLGFGAVFLSGVRTALVGLFLILLIAVVKSGRWRLVPMAVSIAFGLRLLASKIFSFVGAESNVLSADRYSLASLETDRSLLARLDLLRSVRSAVSEPLGTGLGGARADNLVLDLLVSLGPLAAIISSLLIVIVVARSISGSVLGLSGAFGLVSVFLAVFSLSSAILLTTSGLFVALIWGWSLGDRDSRLAAPEREAFQASGA